MAYSGTTAASSLANPPILLVRGLGTLVNAGAVVGSTVQPNVGGTGLWYYASTDGSTLLQAAGYFSDGRLLGMRNGDFMLIAAATAVGSTTVGIGLGMLMTTNSTAGYNIAANALIASS
jgi:hypothetical protein